MSKLLDDQFSKNPAQTSQLIDLLAEAKANLGRKVIVNGNTEFKFGLTGLKASTTPIYLYNAPEISKKHPESFTDGVHLFINEAHFKNLVLEDNDNAFLRNNKTTLVDNFILKNIVLMALNNKNNLINQENYKEALVKTSVILSNLTDNFYLPSAKAIGLFDISAKDAKEAFFADEANMVKGYLKAQANEKAKTVDSKTKEPNLNSNFVSVTEVKNLFENNQLDDVLEKLKYPKNQTEIENFWNTVYKHNDAISQKDTYDSKAPHIKAVDEYIRTVIKSSLTDNEEAETIKQATELAQDFISGNAVSQEKISRNFSTGYSAKEQIFEYYFAKALANAAVDAIVLKNENLVTISQRLMKGHIDTKILPEMVSVSIDILKDRLAVEKDELAVVGQRSLSVDVKKNIVTAMGSLPNITIDHVQYLSASISNMDKFTTGTTRKLKM